MPKTRDIKFDLNINLDEFYTGKKKKLIVKRKKIVTDNQGIQSVVEEKKKLIVPIERGMKDEQQIRFEGEADQIPGYLSGDIIITLIENEHPVFQRKNDNLIIIKNINFYEVFDLTFDLKHLDSKVIKIKKDTDDLLYLNDSIRVIKGMGMPIYYPSGGSKNNYGDLFIRFNIIMPLSMDHKLLPIIKQVFNTNEKSSMEYTKHSSEHTLELVNKQLKEFSESMTYSSSDSMTDSTSDSISDSGSELDSESESLTDSDSEEVTVGKKSSLKK
jgi:DnaJ-class molecular chaperone